MSTRLSCIAVMLLIVPNANLARAGIADRETL
jgi:hypothetical protein